MGIIFNRTLKCENCGYIYQGRNGGHVISNGEHYGISQYYCNTCHSIIDLEYYSSLKENKEKYIYPDKTEALYQIKKEEKEAPKNTQNISAEPKNIPPLCQECGNHLIKLDIDSDRSACCPNCGHQSLKQKEIHVSACID